MAHAFHRYYRLLDDIQFYDIKNVTVIVEQTSEVTLTLLKQVNLVS